MICYYTDTDLVPMKMPMVPCLHMSRMEPLFAHRTQLLTRPFQHFERAESPFESPPRGAIPSEDPGAKHSLTIT